jgi:hypothetical protein
MQQSSVETPIISVLSCKVQVFENKIHEHCFQLTTFYVNGRIIEVYSCIIFVRQYAILYLHFKLCFFHLVDFLESHLYACIMLIYYDM